MSCGTVSPAPQGDLERGQNAGCVQRIQGLCVIVSGHLRRAFAGPGTDRAITAPRTQDDQELERDCGGPCPPCSPSFRATVSVAGPTAAWGVASTEMEGARAELSLRAGVDIGAVWPETMARAASVTPGRRALAAEAADVTVRITASEEESARRARQRLLASSGLLPLSAVTEVFAPGPIPAPRAGLGREAWAAVILLTSVVGGAAVLVGGAIGILRLDARMRRRAEHGRKAQAYRAGAAPMGARGGKGRGGATGQQAWGSEGRSEPRGRTGEATESSITPLGGGRVGKAMDGAVSPPSDSGGRPGSGSGRAAGGRGRVAKVASMTPEEEAQEEGFGQVTGLGPTPGPGRPRGSRLSTRLGPPAETPESSAADHRPRGRSGRTGGTPAGNTPTPSWRGSWRGSDRSRVQPSELEVEFVGRVQSEVDLGTPQGEQGQTLLPMTEKRTKHVSYVGKVEQGGQGTDPSWGRLPD